MFLTIYLLGRTNCLTIETPKIIALELYIPQALDCCSLGEYR